MASWAEAASQSKRRVILSDSGNPQSASAGYGFRWTNIDAQVDEHWKDLEQTPFDANVHPELTLAARSAAKGLNNALDLEGVTFETQSPGKQLNKIKVDATAIPESHRKSIVTAFTNQLHADYPPLKIELVETLDKNDKTESEDDVLKVELRLDHERVARSPWDKSQTIEHGSLKTSASMTNEHHSVNVHASHDYIEEVSWVTDFAKFKREYPGKRYVIGYSRDFMSSEIAARKSANSHARSQFSILYSGRNARLADGQFVVDVFSQKLSRPYGDVWRSAVLLDVSDEAISLVTNVSQQRAATVRARRLSAGTGLLLLLSMTVLIAISLNVFTQGYYRGSLTTGGAIVVLGLVATLFVMNLI